MTNQFTLTGVPPHRNRKYFQFNNAHDCNKGGTYLCVFEDEHVCLVVADAELQMKVDGQVAAQDRHQLVQLVLQLLLRLCLLVAMETITRINIALLYVTSYNANKTRIRSQYVTNAPK